MMQQPQPEDWRPGGQGAHQGRYRLLALALVVVLALGTVLLLTPRPIARPSGALTLPQQALYSFLDAAFAAEYQNRGRNYLLRWQQPVRVSLEGAYQPEDEAWLDSFLKEIESKRSAHNMPAFPGITRVSGAGQANMRVIFCPLDEMERHLTYYEPNNWGLFEYFYEDARIYRATVVVASDVTTQMERNHLLMEEIVGALGLTNDIFEHPDSIIYQGWTQTQQLSELDWLMLSFLYSDRVQPGMTSRQAYAQLLPLVEGL